MNKLFKKLFAPIAILSMALGVTVATNNFKDEVGTKAATFSDVLSIKGWAGYTNGSYTTAAQTATAPTSGATVTMTNFNGSTGQVRGNQTGAGNFHVSNSTEYPGYIRKITLKASSTGSNYLVTEAARSLLSLSATPIAFSTIPTADTYTADTISTTLYTVTWTVPAGVNFKYFKLHSLKTSGTVLAAGADALTIEYETVSQTFGTLDRIEVSGGKTSYLVGETFTNSGLIVTAFDTTNFSKTVTSYTTNKDSYVFLSSDIGTVTITVSYTEGVTKTDTFDVTVASVVEFSKIIAATDIYFGADYVIVAEGATTPKIMTTTFTTFFDQTNVTITSDKVVNLETHQIIRVVISPVTGTYGFLLVNGPQAGKYLALTSDANSLNVSATLDNSSSWFVTFDAGNAIINSADFPTRNIRYNNSNPRFATYTTSQTAIQLYLNMETVDHTESATMFATEVNSGKGSTAQGTCAATLEFLNSAYGRLSSTAKNTFDTSSNSEFISARARLTYLGSWVAANPSARPTMNSNGNNNLFAVITIGAIGLTSILAYFFLNKKKVLR
jgi:hypothetical protein